MASKTHIPRTKGSKKAHFKTKYLDKRDEMWCYVLIKMFTRMLEESEIDQNMLFEPPEFNRAFQTAVKELTEAIHRKKSCIGLVSSGISGEVSNQSVRKSFSSRSVKSSNIWPTESLLNVKQNFDPTTDSEDSGVLQASPSNTLEMVFKQFIGELRQ